ncbi:hypothetical protein [Cephaloticoccus primus]|uniref:hypothetical protein n=1 Tax=Cephaloticoccus primus TaxID=1548207 RepID=UPI0012E94B60|nr:hypothetical protein [Cephaloticoccus primus]
MTISGEVAQVNMSGNSTANIDGILSVGAGGIRGPNYGNALITGGALTSSSGKVDIGITGDWPGSTTIIRSRIVDSEKRSVGVYIHGEVWGSSPDGKSYGVVYMEGAGDNTFTGDVVVEGKNELSLRWAGRAVQGNIYAIDKGVILSHRSGQIGENSTVTLREDGSAFGFHTAASNQVKESFHQLAVEGGSSVLTFSLTRPDEFKGQRDIFLDDLRIEEGASLRVENWKEGFSRLLVRKDSEHLQESLGRLEFLGYRKGGELKEYNKDYWEISGLPEPATCGALFGILGFGLIVWRKRQQTCRTINEGP